MYGDIEYKNRISDPKTQKEEMEIDIGISPYLLPAPPRPRRKSMTEDQVIKLTGLNGVELAGISLSQLLGLVDKRSLTMTEYDCLKYK